MTVLNNHRLTASARSDVTARTIAVLAALCCLVSGPGASAGDAAAGKAKAGVCAACHGADGNGNSANPMWPKIAGQNEGYFVNQVLAIKSGEGRANAQSATMAPMVQNLSEQDIRDLAAFYATQTGSTETAAAETVELGERLYRGGDAASGIPACMSCHGPDGAGNAMAAYPKVSGQHAAYARAQLEAFRSGERTTDTASMMRSVAAKLTDAQIDALASYMAGLH